MLIGICDNDRQWCSFSAGIIRSYLEKRGYKAEIVIFEDGNTLTQYHEQVLDILFMSIVLQGEKNGIALAKYMNKKYPRCQIVFLTDYLHYAVDVYETEHAYFVLKEELENRMPKIFRQVERLMKKSRDNYFFTASWGREVVVKEAEMYYLERDLRQTIVHTAWGFFQIREKLDDLMEKLPRVFSRCHHSYIVFFPAVREKRKNSYLLKDGTEIIISRSYSKQTGEDWNLWSGER